MQYMIVVFPDHTRLPFGQDVRLDCEHKMSFGFLLHFLRTKSADRR